MDMDLMSFTKLTFIALYLLPWTDCLPPLKTSTHCLDNPCQNRAECREAPYNFLCQCQSLVPVLPSRRCHSSGSPCQSSICQGNATCQATGAHPGELVCQCVPSVLGHDCHASVQLCAQKLCIDGAHCLALQNIQGPGYACICQEGYTGTFCERKVDHCSPNPCRNRAICRSTGEGPTCFCVPGFQGKRCDIEVNECVSGPCRNGATCLDKIGHYVCLCKPGYTGSRCEVEIDECQSQPCLHGGSCHDHISGFSCTCLAGFGGERCETNIDECSDQPCRNGAVCVDEINGYHCDCLQTGFTGVHCELPPPPCWSQPCLNSAPCQEEGENYTCKCWPGFEGHNCEADISECESSPCVNEGTCIELSWETLYGTELLLPSQYNPKSAAGFICRCPPEFTGALCELNITACSTNPCHNAATCEDFLDTYRCICPSHAQDGVLYGGRNCSVPLTGCDGHECQNGASCVPFLSDEVHAYSCTCKAGYIGWHCQTSTAFSFETAGGYLHLQMPLLGAETYFNITLSFRTVQENTVLFRRGSPRLMLILELSGGRLLLSLKSDLDPYSSSWTLTLPQNVSDGDWHTVESMFGKDTLLLRLLETCQGGNHCSKVARIEVGLELDTALETTIFGGLDAGEGSDSFIGCMRDLFVDSQLMVLEEWWHNLAVNITLGCNHQDRCLSGPCENQGECVNLWQGYRCKCRQPFEGPTCAEEYVTARFGLEDSASYAIFSIGERLESEGLSVSVFLRTRKESGLLVLLSNSTMVYFGLWLEKGKLKLQVNSLKSTSVRSSVNDGEIHFVSITIKENEVTLQESGREFKLTDIQPVSVRLGDKVHVGGLDDRQQTFAFGGYFKGCLQDLRLNDGKLQFFPLSGSEISYKPEVMVDVNPGCTSDYSCSKNPCQNGGLCFSAWDDFTCNCPPNTAGRRCEEVSWCGLNPCPPRAACRALRGGYECISNVTFQDNGSLIYRWNGLITHPLTSIMFSIRTRQRNAVVLHAESGSDFVTVSIQNDFLVLELLSGPSLSTSSPLSPVTIHSSKPISDGQWHVVELLMADPWANTSQWIMLQSDETDKPVVSVSVAGNLDFLREDVDVLLGGLGPESGLNLIGCLSNVEIGGLVLPYYGSDELRVPQNLDEKFEKISKVPIQVGCVDRPVCEPNPCLNGGVCEDLFNLLECFCPPGWVGNRCEVNVNSCASNPCRHGNCSEEGLAYSCTCDSSYTGVNCEVKVDECSGHKCANGGTCLRGVGSFSCLCPDKFTGQNCSVRIQEAPWYVVRNVPPKLPVSICGDEKYNYTCFNGGNCSETSMMCDCHPGFLGHWCELDHDECKSNPCLNGGYCHNLVNKFQCVCEMTFAGDICEIDLNAESVTSNLLLSISLVSAVLLLGLFVVAITLVITLTRRATRGTYSPSRQEKEGSRVEMWNIVQPPPMERLI